MEIYERVQQIRKNLGFSRREFGEKLGVTESVIVNIEFNRLKRPDQKEPVYKLICEKFNVNENWLRTGEGEMFEQLSRNQEIVQEVNRVLRGEPESFRSRLISALCRLDESDWEVLEKIALQMAYPNEPPPQILPFAARDGIPTEITEMPEEKEKRRAETLRDLETIPDITLPDK